jgi:hypothetical protein
LSKQTHTIMNLKNTTMCIFGLILALSTSVIAQDTEAEKPEPFIIVTMSDRSEVRGFMVSRDDEFLTLRTRDLGIVKIPVDRILKITDTTGKQEKLDAKPDYWFANPDPNRYMFGPSALPIKKRETYLHTAYIVLGSVQYGFSDRFSMGIGTAITTFVGFPVFTLTPKYTVLQKDKWSIAGGGIFGFFSDDFLFAEWSSAGIGYGVVTYGDAEHNITLGLGYGYAERRFADNVIVTFSGMTRVARRLALITENWFIPNLIDADRYYPVFGYGVRFLSQGFSMDLSLINSRDIVPEAPIGIPYVGVMVKF